MKDLGDLIRMNDLFHESAVLHLATSVGLFDQLTIPATATEIATAQHWVERKTRIVLDVLVALGLLDKSDGYYVDTDSTKRFLTTASDSSMIAIIDHQRLQWSLWGDMDGVLRSDTPTPAQQEVRLARDSAANRAFTRAMIRLSQENVVDLLAVPELAGAGHVLDLCGGHGLYLASLARENPDLTGEVWDLEPARRVAVETLAELGVADRVTFEARDVLAPGAFEGRSADACMLNDCLHYFDRDGVRRVVGGAVSTLAPGGTLIVTTMTLDDDRVTPPGAAGFSLHMMLNTHFGELHPTAWIEEVMGDAGLAVERQPFGSLGRASLLKGHVTTNDPGRMT